MTKADIVEQIAAQTGLTKVETKAVVEGVFSSVMDILANGLLFLITKLLRMICRGWFTQAIQKP